MDPAPWYDERDESGRVPGPREGRHTDEPRYAEDPRYESSSRGGGASRGGGRSGSGRGGGPTRGRRSGLELPPEPAPDAAHEPPIWESGSQEGWTAGAPDSTGWTEGGWEAGRGTPGWEAGATESPTEGQSWTAGADSLDRIDRGELRNRPAPEPAGAGRTYLAGHGPTQAIAPPPSVYRSRRVGIAALLGAAATVADLLILFKVLFDSIAAHPTRPEGILGGLFALAGVPMVAFGLYGLATGAATAGGPNVGRAWLRTPLAYLPIGLILLIAAGLAI